MNRVLMREFNELSPALLTRFIEAGWLPAFARLRARSATFITESDETGVLLTPWVQWVSVHTGVTAKEHGIKKLGEAHQLRHPTLADSVSAAGGSVWLCGSMNVQPTGSVLGCVLPDPWAVSGVPQPAALLPFFRFVQANVQEHTTAANPLSKAETLAFVRFMARHGLSLRTAWATVAQVVGERTARTGRWRRAELLDRVQWDVFRHYYRRLQPTFATFFSNSTAHFQHLHWDELDEDERGSKVLDGYRQLDRIVGQALALAGDDVTVVLCTALSQVANRDANRAREGFYRPTDFAVLNDAFGIRDVVGVAPVMAEQWHIFFTSDEAARTAAETLTAISVQGEPVFGVDRKGRDVFVGCRFFSPRDLEPPLDRLLYWAEAPREGTHHPDGVFWVGAGRSEIDDVRVPLTSVAPTILELIGVEPPHAMRADALLAAR